MFEVNRTKIKGGCQSETILAELISNSKLPLVCNKIVNFIANFDIKRSQGRHMLCVWQLHRWPFPILIFHLILKNSILLYYFVVFHFSEKLRKLWEHFFPIIEVQKVIQETFFHFEGRRPEKWKRFRESLFEPR